MLLYHRGTGMLIMMIMMMNLTMGNESLQLYILKNLKPISTLLFNPNWLTCL